MRYRPHKYQKYAANFILEHPVCCLMLDMGLGKTVITLSALWELALDRFDIGRILVGRDHKRLIPFSALAGAFTFLAADTVGRTIAAPNEISAAVIMSVVGGPFFILLLRRSKKYGD